MSHYQQIEQDYIRWRKSDNQEYPIVTIQKPKDDVVEYSDIWWLFKKFCFNLGYAILSYTLQGSHIVVDLLW